jgi:hypothetical protein
VKVERRRALLIFLVSGAITSFHAFDLRIDSPAVLLGFNYYWLVNLSLLLTGVCTGALTSGSVLLKMGAGIVGVALGLMVFALVMTFRTPGNNLLPLALAINFFVGGFLLWLGTAAGEFIRRLLGPHEPPAGGQSQPPS